jgi:NitT/TauT family transport system ATP-binding protein
MSQPLKMDPIRPAAATLELIPRQRAAAPLETGTAVSVERVSKRFKSKKGDVQAVSDVSLTIGRGEFVSIVGPSGCGKSTLLNMIAGLMSTSDGRIDVLGKPVTGSVPELGVVFQQHLLLPWRTILNNVMLQIEVRKLDRAAYLPRARELLERVGLGDFAERFPDELSGGMNQRAAIVRGLMHDPEVLLMDEPFGALDAMTRDQMCLDFHHLSREQGKTVLFITHSISEAVFLSNRVVVMSPRPGRIEEIVPIELAGERHVDIRDEAEFTRYTRHIRRIFEKMGVLREERHS